MSDTLGVVKDGRLLFGKNSDRSPNEAQIIEYHDALMHFDTDLFIEYARKKPVTHERKAMLSATYIEVEQVRETHAVLLSRPQRMWGAEMGANDCGVCIGSEAVFTKGGYDKTGLTGPDLLRLGLERGDSAESALKVIIENLEKYGQGGSCGYDCEFYYNNSFLIADTENIYVLDTCHREWAWKRYARATVSNRLTLGSDADAYSGESNDFKKAHSDLVYSAFSRADRRREITAKALEKAETPADMMAVLRAHDAKAPFASGSVSSPCMHFGGLVGEHTTQSMVADVTKERTVLWLTGSSCPCVSLFKPWLFGGKPVCPVFYENDTGGEYYWRRSESFRRALIGKALPEDYYAQRDELQNEWIAAADECADSDFTELSGRCVEQEREFFAKWGGYDFPDVICPPGFKKRWAEKNKTFETESSDFGL